MAKSTKEVEALEGIGQVPDARDVFIGAALRSFSHYAEQRIAVADQIKALEEEKKRLDAEITALMTETGAVKVLYQNRPVSLVEGSRSTLNKEKLLLAGVTASVIAASTDKSVFTYLLFGKPKS